MNIWWITWSIIGLILFHRSSRPFFGVTLMPSLRSFIPPSFLHVLHCCESISFFLIFSAISVVLYPAKKHWRFGETSGKRQDNKNLHCVYFINMLAILKTLLGKMSKLLASMPSSAYFEVEEVVEEGNASLQQQALMRSSKVEGWKNELQRLWESTILILKIPSLKEWWGCIKEDCSGEVK